MQRLPTARTAARSRTRRAAARRSIRSWTAFSCAWAACSRLVQVVALARLVPRQLATQLSAATSASDPTRCVPSRVSAGAAGAATARPGPGDGAGSGGVRAAHPACSAAAARPAAASQRELMPGTRRERQPLPVARRRRLQWRAPNDRCGNGATLLTGRHAAGCGSFLFPTPYDRRRRVRFLAS